MSFCEIIIIGHRSNKIDDREHLKM